MSKAELTLFNEQVYNYQSNKFTLSRQTFTELEKKIVALGVNQMSIYSQGKEWKPGQNLTVVIPVSRLTKTNHEKVVAAVRTLQEKKIYFKSDEKVSYHGVVPFPEAKVVKEGKTLHIHLTVYDTVVPIFRAYGRQYTRYEIEVMLQFSSTYSQRLYEIIRSQQGQYQQSFSFTVEELRFFLNCPASYEYREINRRAIRPAIAEIFEKAGLRVTHEAVSKGTRKVTSVKFYVSKREDIEREQKEELKIQIKKRFEQLSSLPFEDQIQYLSKRMSYYTTFTKEQCQKIYDDPSLCDKFVLVDLEIQFGLYTPMSNDWSGYMAKSLGWVVKQT